VFTPPPADDTATHLTATLSPPDLDLEGALAIEMTGPAAQTSATWTCTSHPAAEHTGGVAACGTHDLHLNVPSLAVGEYTQTVGKWTVQGAEVTDSKDYHIQVLGNYYHTRYNTVDESESTCQEGTPETVCFCRVVGGQPQFSSDVLPSRFAYEVRQNGSGISINHGTLQWEAYFNNQVPPEYAGMKVFREFTTITTSCGTTIADGDVAVQVGHNLLSCQNQVYVYRYGTVTVNDTGTRLGHGMEQLDHFTTAFGGTCHDVTSLDPIQRQTIKLLD